MATKGKKYQDSSKLYEKSKLYDKTDAIELVCQTAKAKFDETIEVHVRLGVDSRHADQQVRGAVVLPHGTGKTVRVLALVKPEMEETAKAAGADYVGSDEYIEKIQKENWFDFDIIITTPNMMGAIGRLGRVLGPKGLMPNPKAGTVTMDVAKAVNEAKAGKVEYRLTRPTSFTAPSVRLPSVLKSSVRTSMLSWVLSSRQSPLLQRASTSSPA